MLYANRRPEEIIQRLSRFYAPKAIRNILRVAMSCSVWQDGHLQIFYSKKRDSFSLYYL